MNICRLSLLISLLCLLAAGQGDAADSVWWEGEAAIATNFPDDTWFANGAVEGKRHLLSGGAWLCNEGERAGEEAYARYTLTVPEAGDYEFWVRKFWKHGPFRWRFGDQEWRVVGRDIALADNVDIVTHLNANWVHAGRVELPKGETTFELRLLAEKGESLTACFDAFLLTQVPFMPRGKLKPGEKSGQADEGFFPWEPGIDPFSNEALLDLRHLNEERAGQSGYVRRDGEQFVLGDGTPVRFWAVNLNAEIAAMNRASIDYMAKNLAKRGVNMVRYHSPLFDPGNVDRLDAKKLDNLHYLVHSLKQEGIYTKASFYFPLWFAIKPEYGIEGYDSINNKRPFALLYFNDRMQSIYKSWLRQLLSTQNPYSGKPLSQDPALAIIEIINEDSYFFWTFKEDNIPETHWRELERQFADWLEQKYGSLQAAIAAWGGRESGDRPSQGLIKLFSAWSMTGDGLKQAGASRKKRIGDQVQFLTESQRDFYAAIAALIHDELGSESLVSASNWHVSDPNMLGALERYTYTAGEVIDKHGYFDRGHESDDGSDSFAVRTGHRFENVSAAKHPESLPWQWIQIADFPHIISETNITNPNLFRADFNFFAAAYGALQGVDGIFPFALGGTFWDTSMEKFAVSSPMGLGGFPAYALMFRRGDVQEAEAVIHQILDLNDLYAMKGNGGSAAQAFDEFRQGDIPPGEARRGEVGTIDPLSFYAGKVLREFGESTQDSFVRNLAGYIQRDQSMVKSITGELAWDYSVGVAQLITPKSQGMAGFINAKPLQSEALRIEMNNEYGSIMVIALDNQPVASSNTLLIQTLTAERPFGFRTNQPGNKAGRITNMGGFPLNVVKIDGRVGFYDDRFTNAEVIALDENGYATQKTIKTTSDEELALEIQLAEDAVYHVISVPKKTTGIQNMLY